MSALWEILAIILTLFILYCIASLLFFAAARAFTWLGRRLASGPGPDSELEQVLAAWERGEEAIRSERGDGGEAA